MAPTVTMWVIEKIWVRRLRRQVFQLCRTGELFTGETEDSYVELILLRGLSLERELRQASVFRNREACAMLTRSIVEGALLGLCLLATKDTSSRLRKEAIDRIDDTIKSAWLPTDNLYEDVMETIGIPMVAKGMSNFRQMVDKIDSTYELGEFLDQPIGSYLYWQWYVPLSNFSVHASAAALGRYYRPLSRKMTKRPWGILPRRGAIRVSDGCLGLLGCEIAKKRELPSSWLESYGASQIRRANVPFVVALVQLARHIRMRHIVRLMKVAPKIRQSLIDGSDSEVRKMCVEAILEVMDVPSWIND